MQRGKEELPQTTRIMAASVTEAVFQNLAPLHPGAFALMKGAFMGVVWCFLRKDLLVSRL